MSDHETNGLWLLVALCATMLSLAHIAAAVAADDGGKTAFNKARNNPSSSWERLKRIAPQPVTTRS